MPTYEVIVDPLVTLLAFLLSPKMEPLPSLLGNRIYGGTVPPEGYHVDQGPALLVSSRDSGGTGEGTVYQALTDFSAQFISYGATLEDAQRAMSVLYSLLEVRGVRGGKIRGAYAQSAGQTLPLDPDTNWPGVLAYYQFTIVTEWEEIEVP